MFDCMDIKSAILGASAGGDTGLADAARSWNGDPADRGAGDVKVVLVSHTDDGHAVIVAGQTVASGVGRAADDTERRRGQGYQKLDDTADIELRSGQMRFGARVVR